MRSLDDIRSEIADASLPPFGPTGFGGARYFAAAIFPAGANETPGLATTRAYLLANALETAPYGTNFDAYNLGISTEARRNAVRSLVRDGSLGTRPDAEGRTVYCLPGTDLPGISFRR